MAAATTSSPNTSPQRPNGFVGGDDQRCSFVARRHELEEQVGCFGFERDVADLVDDQQGVAAEPDEFGLDAGRRGGRRPAGPPIRRRWRTGPGARLGRPGSPGRSLGGFYRCPE